MLNLDDPKDRKQARRQLIWHDHGFLRFVFQNLHDIGGGMMRANQPSPEQLKVYADKGVKTILNLRGVSPKGYYLLEKEACDDLGLALVNYRVFSRDTPSKQAIHDLKKIFATIEYPAVMHCKSGADRTGVVGVLYKHFHLGEPISDAMEQLRLRYLHMRHGKTGMLDFFFNEFLRYEAGGGPLEFIDWVDEVYDPVDVKRRFTSGWKGDAVTDKVLRRE